MLLPDTGRVIAGGGLGSLEYQSTPNLYLVRRRAGVSGGVMAVLVAAGVAGCSGQHPLEHGFANQCRTQIQFYAPPGATVTVKACSTRSHEIAQYGPYGNRLEQSPEEFSVFNLYPGRYEFKYTTAEGLPGVSIYGELDVQYANSEIGKLFQDRAFIPVALPSDYYQRVEVAGDEIFPYRGEAYRTAIDEQDMERLKQGDVIEKVFFAADLEKAEKTLTKTKQDIAVCEREIEYAEARFRLAHDDFRMDVADPGANFLGTDKAFIGWEKKRQELEHDLAKLDAKLRRTQALLRSDHVLARKGMLVVATEEIVKPHRDVEEASAKLGEVLLVMRIGGRHMQWGDPRRELAAYQP